MRKAWPLFHLKIEAQNDITQYVIQERSFMNSNKETKHINMLSGSLWKKILIFAVPLVLIGIIEQLFNAADVAVVGRFSGENGKNAMAAVGATSSIIGLIVYTFIAVSLGTNVVIAHAYGASDSSMIKKCGQTSEL